MPSAAMTLGLRPHPRLGPALRRSHLPVAPLALSAGAHLVLVVALIAGAAAWRATQTKTYVVNLVPAVAAVGLPQGTTAPDLPPRIAPPPPRAPEKSTPKELPPPAPAPTLPERATASSSASLPDRSSTPRAPALPRSGEKELPAVPSATTPKSPPTPAPTTGTPPPPRAMAPPLGQAAGASQGAGAVTLNVSDFPYAYYIQAIHRKIQERWEGRAIEGRQPEIIFEIGRDGQLRRMSVGKSSGNPAYDQVAMRAINEANPFPPLPDGFDKSSLTVGLQFIYDARAR